MLVACCTSYPKRIGNLPIVIDSILGNTVSPYKVVIILSLQEFPNKELPENVAEYVEENKKVSIKWVEYNWKVYKKFLPILEDYPNDLIVPFDDDIIYPNDMIEQLMDKHEQYPNAPIAANHFWYGGLKAHCGAGSLVMSKHFKGWEQYVNDEMIEKCPADDLFYTQLAAMNGYFYENTNKHYPDYWKEYNSIEGYSASYQKINKVTQEHLYEILGQQTKKIFTEDLLKPVCVLNILATPRGLLIEKEFLSWLVPIYNVLVVEHNGTKFEYPGLKLAYNYVTNNDIKVPILYVHSKGAWHVRRESESVRKMWKHEFTKRMDLYLDAVSCNKPMVATPYHGIIHSDWLGIPINGVTYNIPYENGWMANADAVRKMNVYISDNRFIYEVLVYEGIEMVGLRMQNIDGEDIPSRRKITEEIMTFR